MSTPSPVGSIIIRSASQSPTLAPSEQRFMAEVADKIEGGAQPNARERERCKRLLGKVCFG